MHMYIRALNHQNSSHFICACINQGRDAIKIIFFLQMCQSVTKMYVICATTLPYTLKNYCCKYGFSMISY